MTDETHKKTLKKIEADFNLLNEKFQKESIELALKLPKEVTPLLLNLLKPATHKPEKMDVSYNGHLYALYLLSKFKEAKAFPLLLKMTLLTEDELDTDLDDFITDNLHRFLADTYHNNFNDLKIIVESEETSVWAKHIIFNTIITLASRSLLTTDLLCSLFTSLFENPAYSPDGENYLSLIRACYDLDAKYFYKNILNALLTDKTNTIITSIVITQYSLEKKAANQNYTSIDDYSQNIKTIDDVITEMKDLSCFD